MKKRTYIQPEMMIEGLSSQSSLMLLGSPTAPEVGKSNAPAGGTNPAPKRLTEIF